MTTQADQMLSYREAAKVPWRLAFDAQPMDVDRESLRGPCPPALERAHRLLQRRVFRQGSKFFRQHVQMFDTVR